MRLRRQRTDHGCGGRGDFVDVEEFNGRQIFMRNDFSKIMPNSCYFEQAFSGDNGRMWEANGNDVQATKMIRGFLGLLLVVSAVAALAQEKSAPAETARPASVRDGQHDFDWEFGNWHTHLWRLKQPLSGSNEWVEYDGTTVVRKIWDGRANLVEREVDGPTHIEALNLRLYNPETHKWSLNFASSKGGTLGTPTVGEFKNGRGEFFDQENFNGRPVLVRFIISDIKTESCKFEQSFSTDSGKTWEVNWIAIDTRVKQ